MSCFDRVPVRFPFEPNPLLDQVDDDRMMVPDLSTTLALLKQALFQISQEPLEAYPATSRQD